MPDALVPPPESTQTSRAIPDARPARLIKARDYAWAVVHIGALAGLTVGTACLVSQTAILVSAGLAGAITFAGPTIFEKLSSKLAPHDTRPVDAPDLPEMIDDLTARARLRQKPPVMDFEMKDAKESDADKKHDTDVFANQPHLRRIINAAAANFTRPIVLVSEPLLKLMGAGERKAVLAHEFVHLGAHHSRLRAAAGFLQTTTMFMAFSIPMGVAIQSTLAAGLSMAAFIGIGLGGYALIDKMNRKKEHGMELPRTRQMQRGVFLTQELVGVGILVAANPLPMLSALAAEWSIFWAGRLIGQSYSRRNEFQADRGAVELGADPLALVTSLRKMEAVQARDYPINTAWADHRRGPWWKRAYKRVESLGRTHPYTEARCKRLAAIAKKQGRTDEEIAAALTGPVDISGLPPLPATDDAWQAEAEKRRKEERAAEKIDRRDEAIRRLESDLRLAEIGVVVGMGATDRLRTFLGVAPTRAEIQGRVPKLERKIADLKQRREKALAAHRATYGALFDDRIKLEQEREAEIKRLTQNARGHYTTLSRLEMEVAREKIMSGVKAGDDTLDRLAALRDAERVEMGLGKELRAERPLREKYAIKRRNQGLAAIGRPLEAEPASPLMPDSAESERREAVREALRKSFPRIARNTLAAPGATTSAANPPSLG